MPLSSTPRVPPDRSAPPPRNRPRSYQVRRLADGQDYALKHIDISAVPPAEYGDLVNEIRCGPAGMHAAPWAARCCGDRRPWPPPHPTLHTRTRTSYSPPSSLMAAVEHPNLVAYREAWVERRQLFVVVELASGGDLGTLLG